MLLKIHEKSYELLLPRYIAADQEEKDSFELALANEEATFDIQTIVELLTTKPRRVFGLKSNCIKEGNEAAISLFSTTESRVFSEKEILSTSKNSLFLGKEIKGKVYGIYANQKLVLNEATLNL